MFNGTDLLIITNGAGASGIILDSEDDTIEIKGSGALQATFDTGGLNLVTGDAYEINGTSVLNATTLGTGVLASSLTSVGTISSGTWEATDVGVAHGGTGASSLTDGGILLGSGTGAITATAQPASGQLLIGSVGVDPVLATLTAGTDITITEGAGTITIASTAAGGGWVEETTTSRALAVNESVVGNNASLITMTLPTTAAFGSIIRLAGKGAGLIKVGQNASEIIHFGTSTTTTGVGGSITSTEVNDAVELLCIVADTEWQVLSSQGNWTIV